MFYPGENTDLKYNQEVRRRNGGRQDVNNENPMSLRHSPAVKVNREIRRIA